MFWSFRLSNAFWMTSKFLLFFNFDIGHQENFLKSKHLQAIFLVFKPLISLQKVQNRWANMLKNLKNQKNNDFTSRTSSVCKIVRPLTVVLLSFIRNTSRSTSSDFSDAVSCCAASKNPLKTMPFDTLKKAKY